VTNREKGRDTVDLVLTGATVLPMGGAEPIPTGAVAIAGDSIIAVGPADAVRDEVDTSGAEVIDLPGAVVLPGCVNVHTHLGLTWARGLVIGDRHPVYDVFWPLERALDPEIVKDLSGAAVADSLLSGTTTVADHYFFTDSGVEACIELGLRSAAGLTVMTLDGPRLHDESSSVAEAERFVDAWLDRHPLVHPSVAPHAPDTCDDDTLRTLTELARDRGVPLHFHLAQTDQELRIIAERSGLSPIAHVDELGMLDGGPTLAAQCSRSSDADLARLADRPDTTAVYCPTVHAIDGVSLRAAELLAHGGNVGIGTDCAPNDSYSVLAEARNAVIAQGVLTGRGDAIAPVTALELATTRNAHALGLGDRLGRLAPGCLADIVVLEPRSATAGFEEPQSAVVMGANARTVDRVYVNGALVVADGQLVSADEADVAERANRAARTLRERAGI
jgi:5-methylthioadenosine/S-adenosylhomocysteine deaminase